MDKKTKGAWLIHHTNKLQRVTHQGAYQKTFAAGKAGLLLSAISASNQITVSNDHLTVLASAANINTELELPTLLTKLSQQQLIDVTPSGVSVLGVTTGTVLQHTADIFDSSQPSSLELAAIELAERASQEPVVASKASKMLGDMFHLARQQTTRLMSEAEQIGFVDAERIDSTETLLFNGNLFRRNNPKKIKAVLDSLKPSEQQILNDFITRLRQAACIPEETAKSMLGEPLYSKTTAIGLFDINVVRNATENVAFLTLPSAFSKYSTSMIDDAFDLAKAFVSSVTYGMTRSSYERGQIRAVEPLLYTLIRGESVGPVNAIAEDYKILEMKHVVQVSIGTKNRRTGPMLTLLKKDVGELALQVIQQGDASEHSLTNLPKANVSEFAGPEINREAARRQQLQTSPQATNDMLSILRSGGGI